MEWWQIYLFTRLDEIKNTVVFFTVILLCITVTLSICSFVYESWKNSEEQDKQIRKQCRKWAIICGIVFIPANTLCLAIPTQKDMAVIYLLPKLTKSEFAKEVQQLPTEVVKLMRLKVDVWINDLVKDGTIAKSTTKGE